MIWCCQIALLLVSNFALVLSVEPKEEPEQDKFGTYLEAYIPPGDESYTNSYVGDNSSWRHFMDQYSGSTADYTKYLADYGGPQADYSHYVSLYSSMAGSNPTSGNNWQSKGGEQLSAWNKSMTSTFDTYIPGSFENFAEQSTDSRMGQGGGGGQGSAGRQGAGGSSKSGGEGGGGGGAAASGSGGGASGYWPFGAGRSVNGATGGAQGEASGGPDDEVGYKPFALKFVEQYATSEGLQNAFDYEGKEFASNGMQAGNTAQYAEYMMKYAPDWVSDTRSATAMTQKDSSASKSSAKSDESTGSAKNKASSASSTKDLQANLKKFDAVEKQVEIAEVGAAQLRNASSDVSFAAWSVSRHPLPAAKTTETKKQRTEALQLWAITSEKDLLETAKKWQQGVEKDAAAAKTGAKGLLQHDSSSSAAKAAAHALLHRAETADAAARVAGPKLEKSFKDALHATLERAKQNALRLPVAQVEAKHPKPKASAKEQATKHQIQKPDQAHPKTQDTKPQTQKTQQQPQQSHPQAQAQPQKSHSQPLTQKAKTQLQKAQPQKAQLQKAFPRPQPMKAEPQQDKTKQKAEIASKLQNLRSPGSTSAVKAQQEQPLKLQASQEVALTPPVKFLSWLGLENSVDAVPGRLLLGLVLTTGLFAAVNGFLSRVDRLRETPFVQVRLLEMS